MTRKSWRCFHCNQLFTNPRHAAEHFGASEASEPACKLGDNSGLIALLRQQEKALASYRAEDNALLRGWNESESTWRDRVRRAEEVGYDRGVRDVLAMYEAGTISQLIDERKAVQ